MSTKRKVTFAEEAEEESRRVKMMKRMEELKELNADETQVTGGTGVAAKGKHTLDSDEEDAVEETNTLDLDDIEGQEESKVDIEDGIRFTPFNLKEEYEEGEFDADGMYIFNKNKNQIKDNWIDDIDWAKIKQTEKTGSSSGRVAYIASDDDSIPETLDVTGIYRLMLKLMMPGETVQRAIKRLGGAKPGGSSAPPRRNRQIWKTKTKNTAKTTTSEEENMETESSAAADGKSESTDGGEVAAPVKKPPVRKPIEAGKEDMIQLIGYADKLLSMNGEMEIYQDTYERLSYKVKSAEEETGAAVAVAAPVDSGLDMFADEKPTTAGNSTGKTETTKDSVAAAATSKPGPSASPAASEVKWEYKWENTPDAAVHGPFSSSEMLEWTRDDYFPDGVFVRKTSAGPDGSFYSSRRIDFEIYI